MNNIKNILILILLAIGFSDDWIGITSDRPEKPNVSLVTSSDDNSIISLDLSGFSLEPVVIDGSEYYTVKFPVSASILEQGNPDLPKISISFSLKLIVLF